MYNEKKINETIDNPIYSLYLQGEPCKLSNNKKIKTLIANSDIIFCKLLKEYTKKYYPNISMIIIEDNGKQLLEKIESEKPELIIIGCNLKEVHGEKVIEQLQSKETKPIIFVISALFIDKKYVEYIYSIGANYCIKKFTPFNKIFEQVRKYV